MFGSTMLDVVIGLTYLFVMLSLVATALREAIEAVLKTRAIQLETGIRTLLADELKTVSSKNAPVAARLVTDAGKGKIGAPESITKTLFEHPLLYGLFRGDYAKGANTLAKSWLGGAPRVGFASQMPSYVPAKSFASALIDTIARGPVADGEQASSPLTFAQLRAGLDAQINAVPISPQLNRALTIALDDAGQDLEKARANIEAWFDSGMERVTGWYKRETQWILLAIGLALAVLGNVDSIAVAQSLTRDAALRSIIVQQAAGETEALRKTLAAPPAVDVNGQSAVPGVDALKLADADWDKQMKRAEKLGYPVGWNRDWQWTAPVGWLITAFAVSLGAPFWFDVLSKVMSIRTSIRPKSDPGPSGVSSPISHGSGSTTSATPPVIEAGFEPQRWAASAGRTTADEGVL